MDEAEVDRALRNTFVIIPMLNEKESIASVLRDLPAVRKVVVVDNGCTDESPAIARAAGAEVIEEPQRGYGKACLKGIAHVDADLARELDLNPADVVVAFLDADYSDHPEELRQVIEPIARGEADFVVGSRSRGNRESGAMPFQAIFGNHLACGMMRLFWGGRFTDLGPFRAIGYLPLKQLGMIDEDFGWTVEMQIKALQHRLRCTEVPVSYRRRMGVSKISGTISGTIRAGYKIIFTLIKYRCRRG